MKLLNKEYRISYADDAARLTSSDSISILFLKGLANEAICFTNFVSFDRSLYQIAAIVFAPQKEFYFSGSVITDYKNNPSAFPSLIKVNGYSGLVENVNGIFNYVTSIATKTIYDETIITDNKRAFCESRDFVYQGRYGDGTPACDIIMKDYCSINPGDPKCSCIAHSTFLEVVHGIPAKYTSALKPSCHVSECSLDGYQSRAVLEEKMFGVCAPVNICIQNMNITDSSILSSQVIMECKQEQNNTTTVPKPGGGNETTITPAPGGTTPEVPAPEILAPGGTTPEIPKTETLDKDTSVPAPGGTIPKVEMPAIKEESFKFWSWLIIIVIFLFIITAAIFFIKKNNTPYYEYFTLDNTFNDGFVGTEFNL